MTLTGFATLDGTARYRDRFNELAAENHFRNEQKLWLSSIGIGTYLGNADETNREPTGFRNGCARFHSNVR